MSGTEKGTREALVGLVICPENEFYKKFHMGLCHVAVVELEFNEPAVTGGFPHTHITFSRKNILVSKTTEMPSC